MAPFLLLLFLLSEAAFDLIVVTVPGDDVILSCQAAGSSIRVVEWTRPDLEPDIVLLNIDGRLKTADQHPSFKDRVELVYRDLKDGDVSLTLKNVSRHDAERYKCRVKTGGSGRTKRDTDSDQIRLIRTVRLQFPDVIVVVDPGDDVILPCRAADSSISAVEWTRRDLKPDKILSTDGYLNPDDQNPSFKDRVELVDRDLKGGDVSLKLRNVNRYDRGTYECRVASGDSRRKKRSIRDSEPIRFIRLQVTEPADVHGSVAGALLLVLAVAVAAVAVVMYKRRDNRPGPAAEDTLTLLTTQRD